MSPGPAPKPPGATHSPWLENAKREKAERDRQAAGDRDAERKTKRARTPSAPAYLGKIATEYWRAQLPDVIKWGMFQKGLDETPFAMLCTLYERWRACTDFLNAHGMTYKVDTSKPSDHVVNEEGVTESGEIIWIVKTHPQVKEERELMKQFTSLAARFGLDPSSRLSMELRPAAPPAGKDKKRDYVRTG